MFETYPYPNKKGFFGANLMTVVLVTLFVLALFVYGSSRSKFTQQPEPTVNLALKQTPPPSQQAKTPAAKGDLKEAGPTEQARTRTQIEYYK